MTTIDKRLLSDEALRRISLGTYPGSREVTDLLLHINALNEQVSAIESTLRESVNFTENEAKTITAALQTVDDWWRGTIPNYPDNRKQMWAKCHIALEIMLKIKEATK